MIDRRAFFAAIRATLFGGRLKADQVAGIDAILDRWEKVHRQRDLRWLAYMFGTAHHETGASMQPVRETFATSDAQAIARLDAAFASGRLPWVSQPYWLPDDSGRSWLGRGFVQLTHERNYRRMSGLIGVDLLTDPDRAMELEPALAILFTGMLRGAFTGHKLAHYFSGEREEWYAARRIINGLESAGKVAALARAYHSALASARA